MKNARTRAFSQPLRPQFISPADRGRLVRKAESLQAARVLRPVHVSVLKFLLFRSPGAFTGVWTPSHSSIAAACGVCVRTIGAALDALRSAGVLDWTARAVLEGGALRRLSNAYRFCEAFLVLEVEAFASHSMLFPVFRAVRAFGAAVRRPRLALGDVAAVDPPASPPVRGPVSFSASLLASPLWRAAKEVR